jgi:hypothetical protein
MTCGRLDIPSLAELRIRVKELGHGTGQLRVREVVADAKTLHEQSESANALFQVASQFNLLEMPGPWATPEQGIAGYENDPTQGPACAIACAAGTLYRNYFVPVGRKIGQSTEHQVDCLSDFGAAVGNQSEQLWTMRNGYALPSIEGLNEVTGRLRKCTLDELDILRQYIRIGVQWQTEVTLPGAGHVVSQVYCSAMPVSYSGLPSTAWKELATVVLEASYEATLQVAVLNARQFNQPKVYLTLLGGGAFGNENSWIISAIERALQLHGDYPLDVVIVSYGQSRPEVAQLVSQWRS